MGDCKEEAARDGVQHGSARPLTASSIRLYVDSAPVGTTKPCWQPEPSSSVFCGNWREMRSQRDAADMGVTAWVAPNYCAWK